MYIRFLVQALILSNVNKKARDRKEKDTFKIM